MIVLLYYLVALLLVVSLAFISLLTTLFHVHHTNPGPMSAPI